MLVLTLMFTGCASEVFFRDGKPIASFQGDMTNVTLKDGDLYFHADSINNSAATAAAYTGGTSMVGAVASGVVSGLLVKP